MAAGSDSKQVIRACFVDNFDFDYSTPRNYDWNYFPILGSPTSVVSIRKKIVLLLLLWSSRKHSYYSNYAKIMEKRTFLQGGAGISGVGRI